MQLSERVQQVLLSRMDTPLAWEALHSLSQLRDSHAGDEDLRDSIEWLSLELSKQFLDHVEPTERRLDALERNVSMICNGLEEECARVMQLEREAASFLSEAADISRLRNDLEKDIEDIKEFSAQFEIRPSDISALNDGPQQDPNAFFSSLNRVMRLCKDAFSYSRKLSDDMTQPSNSSSLFDRTNLSTNDKRTMLLDILDTANAYERAGLDTLAEWCQSACREADKAFAQVAAVASVALGATADKDSNVPVLPFPPSILESETRLQGYSLRYGMRVLMRHRPEQFRACQEMAINKRRIHFVKSFVEMANTIFLEIQDDEPSSVPPSTMSIAGRDFMDAASVYTQRTYPYPDRAIGRGDGGGYVSNFLVPGSEDPIRLIPDLFAFIHVAGSEEKEIFSAVFGSNDSIRVVNESICQEFSAANAKSGRVNTDLVEGVSMDPSHRPPQRAIVDKYGTAESGNGAEPTLLLTVPEMLTKVIDGITNSLSSRIEDIIDSLTYIPRALRVADILVFFWTQLVTSFDLPLPQELYKSERFVEDIGDDLSESGELVEQQGPSAVPTSPASADASHSPSHSRMHSPGLPGSSLLVNIAINANRAMTRLNELLVLTYSRIREMTIHPARNLTPASILPDCANLCKELLLVSKMSLSTLLSEDRSALAKSLDLSFFRLSSFHFQSMLKDLLTAVLEKCSDAVSGFPVSHASIFMINNIVYLQTIFVPYKSMGQVQQLLATQLAGWEETLWNYYVDQYLTTCGIRNAVPDLLIHSTLDRSLSIFGKFLDSKFTNDISLANLAQKEGYALSDVSLLTSNYIGMMRNNLDDVHAQLDQLTVPTIRSSLYKKIATAFFDVFMLLLNVLSRAENGYLVDPSKITDILPYTPAQMRSMLELS